MITKHTIVPIDDERLRSDTASIVELPDGELLITYHSYGPGEDGSGDFGKARIYMKRSVDRGVTWHDERLIADIEPGDLNVMSPYLCRYNDEVLLGYVRNHSMSDTSMVLRRSSDGGRTFSEPGYIWNHCGEYRLQGGASSLVLLSDGRLLFPYQSVPEVWVTGENEYVGSYVSDDGGNTWKESTNKVYLPLRGAMEPSAAELSDGTIVMSLRTQLGSVFLTRSNDRGESWELAQTSGLPSPESCTCLRRIPGSEDQLVLFWNDAAYIPDHHHYGIRTPLSAAISVDRGESFKKRGDIDAGDLMLTNLGCTFLSTGEAIVTYLSGIEPEVKNGVYAGPAPEREGGTLRFELNCAIIDRAWFALGTGE